MRLSYESQVRVSTVRRYGKPQALDQLEEWMKEKAIPYISNDKFSQKGIFDYWSGRLSGHAHFFPAGKQHDALKKRTMDKTLESTLKTSINTTLPTCDMDLLSGFSLACLICE